jgi:hypothetical protein
MKRQILGIVLITVLAGCGSKSKLEIPNGIYSPDSLALIQADFYVVEAANNLALIKPDSTNPRYEDYYKKVLEMHHTTKEKVDSSLKFYAHNPVLFNEILNKTTEILELRKIKKKKYLAN